MLLSESQWEELGEYRTSLEHYGVPGMKWGVRKARETSGRTRKKAAKKLSYLERRKKQLAEKRRKKKQKIAEREAKRRKNILNSPTRLYKNRRKFTQDEINEAMKQFKWEAELQQYSQKQLKAGKDYIDSIFNYGTAAINVYNMAARVVNSFDLSEKPWTYVETASKNKDKKDKKDD